METLARELPVSGLMGWREYAEAEPFGPAALDARIGYVLAVLVNAISGKRTRAEDYTPRWRAEEPETPQSFEDMYSAFQDWKNAHHR